MDGKRKFAALSTNFCFADNSSRYWCHDVCLLIPIRSAQFPDHACPLRRKGLQNDGRARGVVAEPWTRVSGGNVFDLYAGLTRAAEGVPERDVAIEAVMVPPPKPPYPGGGGPSRGIATSPQELSTHLLNCRHPAAAPPLQNRRSHRPPRNDSSSLLCGRMPRSLAYWVHSLKKSHRPPD